MCIEVFQFFSGLHFIRKKEEKMEGSYTIHTLKRVDIHLMNSGCDFVERFACLRNAEGQVMKERSAYPLLYDVIPIFPC